MLGLQLVFVTLHKRFATSTILSKTNRIGGTEYNISVVTGLLPVLVSRGINLREMKTADINIHSSMQT